MSRYMEKVIELICEKGMTLDQAEAQAKKEVE